MTSNNTIWPDGRDPWAGPAAGDPRGGAPYAAAIEAVRLLQNRIAGATPSAELLEELASRLDELSGRLAEFSVAEPRRWDGMRDDIPGRGHLAVPPYVIEEQTGTGLYGRVTFGRVHLGGNGAVHGGVPPLLFDDLLGRVSYQARQTPARTAFLHVNYRKISPIEVELRFEAGVDKIEGRKRWASARLFDPSGDLTAEAEGLFVELLPGQP